LRRIKVKAKGLAEELRAKYGETETCKGLRRRFARIMKKYGINSRVLIKGERGSTTANPVYSLYRNAYVKGIMDDLTFDMTMESLRKGKI